LGKVVPTLMFGISISPHLRLLVSDAGSIEDERFHGGIIRQLALHTCIATLRPNALLQMRVLGLR
jgi:hypothetical protein